MRLSFIILLTALLLEKGNGNATVLVYLSHYDNPGGLKSNGDCCDGYWDYSCGPCDHYFKVCLDKVSGSPDDFWCHYIQYTTGVTSDWNNNTFGRIIGGTQNPMVLLFPRWPGSLLLKVQVWDDEYPYQDEFVELLTTTVTINASRSRAGKRYKSFTVKNRTQLDFDIAVFCDENWYGAYCDIYCKPNRKSYRCGHNREKVCYPVWTGENCMENIDKCGGAYCYKPGGKCVDNYHGICECSLGYTGQTCYDEIDECAPNPCLNEGTCLDKIGKFQCLCPLGFTGPTCETDIDECASNPCDNNATCVDVIGNFWCLCPSGYTGLTCENQIDECASRPCDNNATCVDRIDHFLCLCPNGYTGPTCKADIDECDSNPCQNNANCVNHIGQFQCLCAIGYTGSTCEIRADASSCTSCDNDGTGSQASQTGFPILPVVISTAAVFLIVVIMLVVIWKVYQKQKRQTERESRTQAYAIDLDDIEPYYVSKSTRMQPMTDDNPYSEVEGTETGRNTYCNMHEAAANETNIYINQREETEAEANAYLHPRDDLQANTYLELLPNINQSEEAEAEANAYLHPRDDLQANTYLELLPN